MRMPTVNPYWLKPPRTRPDVTAPYSTLATLALAELLVHRPAVDQPEPAARDPIDEPQPHDAERHPGYEQAHAQRGHHEEHAERHPQLPVPERADLPPEVRFEPRPARLAPLHVVEDDGDDRRPAGEERTDEGGGGDHSRDQAEGVQAVDHVCQGNQRLLRLGDAGRVDLHGRRS